MGALARGNPLLQYQEIASSGRAAKRPRNDRGLSSRRGSHQYDFIFLFQRCIHAVQVTDVYAIDKDIKVFPQVAVRVYKMELNRWILFNNLIQDFLHRRGGHKELSLIVDVILHHSGKADGWHERIVMGK